MFIYIIIIIYITFGCSNYYLQTVNENMWNFSPNECAMYTVCIPVYFGGRQIDPKHVVGGKQFSVLGHVPIKIGEKIGGFN